MNQESSRKTQILNQSSSNCPNTKSEFDAGQFPGSVQVQQRWNKSTEDADRHAEQNDPDNSMKGSIHQYWGQDEEFDRQSHDGESQSDHDDLKGLSLHAVLAFLFTDPVPWSGLCQHTESMNATVHHEQQEEDAFGHEKIECNNVFE